VLRERGEWNHNIHYHDFVLGLVPEGCGRALEVGCGTGLLARKLAARCAEIVAFDVDREALGRARQMDTPESRVSFVEGDVMAHGFPENSFDLISAVATLHHLPLLDALARFRDLLKPGGVLAVVGLYRLHGFVDYSWAAVAMPASRILKMVHGDHDAGAPLHEPAETLSEIRTACEAVLPGFVLQRRLLFRYSMTWQKPLTSAYPSGAPLRSRSI